jgi:hypothetical protein
MASLVSYGRTQRLRKGRNSAVRACRCKISPSICASNIALPCAFKTKLRLKEALRSLVTQGAGVEESRKAPNSRGRHQRRGLHLVCVVSATFFGLAGQCGCVFCLPRVGLTQIGRTSHCPPCRPFAELLESMYQALGFFSWALTRS